MRPGSLPRPMIICGYLAGLDLPLREILPKLVQALIIDFKAAVKALDIPEDYDPPAACLVLVKRYGADMAGAAPG